MTHGLPPTGHLPVPDAESAPFWAAARERKLLYRRCNDCGHHHFYPRHHCPVCWSDNCEWRPASGRGRVYAYTVIHQAEAAVFQERTPYIVVQVDLEEGVRLITNLVECTPEVVHVGMPVEVVYEHVNDDLTLPQFRPLQAG